MKFKHINLLFESVIAEQAHIDEFNRRLHKLDEKKRNVCTINPTDSPSQIRKKCKVANAWGVHYAPVWRHYVEPTQPTEPTPTPDADSGNPTPDAGGDVGGDMEEIQGTGLVYPNSIGPEDDDEFIQKEAMSSTERMRRYNKRHPEKVRKYLKDTVKDRVARNRDRAKAIKKHGKRK